MSKLSNKRLLCSIGLALLLSSCRLPFIPASSSVPSVEESSHETSEVTTSVAITSEGTTSESLTSEELSSASSSQSKTSEAISISEETYEVPEYDSRWPLDFSEYGATFRNRLARLIRSSGTRTIAYKANNDVLAESDKAKNGNGVVPFYHPDTESTNSWNKEHVWPNSRGAGESGPGSDPQMLRPTKSSDNSSRGNKFFGDANIDDAGNTWDPASLGYEAARGECARILFYCATRYYDTCAPDGSGSSHGSTPLSLSNNPGDSSAAHTMGRLDRLIEWNNQYPVTAQEIKRNNYLDNAGFARNPFIDHPEYANWIWSPAGLRQTPAAAGEVSSISLPDIVYKHEYDVVTTLTGLENKSVGIAGKQNAADAWMAMTPDCKGQYTYYILGDPLLEEDGKFKTDSDRPAMFSFNQLSSGKYTITYGSKYLFSYIDGTHYSIGLDSDYSRGSNEWTITIASNGDATVKGDTTGVYLEYFKGSFCGYSSAPKVSLRLFA